MKPFDLKTALDGEFVKLRDGSKAIVAAEFDIQDGCVDSEAVLLGWIYAGRSWYSFSWTSQGKSEDGCKADYRDIVGMWPETHTVNGFEVPAPVIKKPNVNKPYWSICLGLEGFVEYRIWQGNELDKRLLSLGWVFYKKADGVSNAKAILGIDPEG